MELLSLIVMIFFGIYENRKDLSRHVLEFYNSNVGKIVHKVMVNSLSFLYNIIGLILFLDLWIVKSQGSLKGLYFGLTAFSICVVYSIYFRASTIKI
ncbi:hypothetical protein [Flavobacterium sp. T12S277]|uniref:hypothetical protein n=1 Tax=Flavobacterium sp. T12S277 TaxID=3402752 RepID=UPI003ADCEFD2